MKKNKPSQVWTVFAFNRNTNSPYTGDAANITAKLSIDGAAAVATNDVNPLELEDGYYVFSLTQAETNGDNILILPESTTSSIQVIGSPSSVSTNIEDDINTSLTSVAGEVTSVLNDTNELQTNQGQWLTATGFNTVAPDNAGITANGVAVAALNDPTAAAIADAVWDESQAGHVIAGSFGEYLDAKVSLAGGGSLTVQDIVDGVWNEGTALHLQSGSFGLSWDEMSNFNADSYYTSVKMETLLETDGAAGYQFTTLGLENAPSGSGGSGDWTATEKGQIRYRLGVDGTSATPVATPDLAVESSVQSAASVTADNNTRIQLLQTTTALESTLNAVGVTATDTNVRVQNLNDFDPISDTVARVTLVDTTTDLTNGGSGGPTVQQIVDGVWDESSSAHVIGGTFGAYVDSTLSQIRTVVDDNNTEILLGFSNIATNGVILTSAQQNVLASQASIDALNDFNPASDVVAHVTLVDTTTDLTNGSDCPTAQEIVDAWGNQDQSVYVTQGTLGYYLDAQVSSAGSGGSGLYQATVRVQDSNNDALQGARINVDGTTLTLTTDSSGEVTFNLDSGVYLLEVSPPAGYDTPVGQVLTVSTSDPADTLFTLTQTSPPTGCDVPWIG